MALQEHYSERVPEYFVFFKFDLLSLKFKLILHRFGNFHKSFIFNRKFVFQNIFLDFLNCLN